MTASNIPRYTVSGDNEWIYVTNTSGQIVARCETAEAARALADELNKVPMLVEIVRQRDQTIRDLRHDLGRRGVDQQ